MVTDGIDAQRLGISARNVLSHFSENPLRLVARGRRFNGQAKHQLGPDLNTLCRIFTLRAPPP